MNEYKTFENKMVDEPYHKFVFDIEKHKPVLEFEQMYQAEDIENYDSWHLCDMRRLRTSISLLILDRYNWMSILDVGCGKGFFTHKLKRKNNHVIGIDISETALKKARNYYPDIEFTDKKFLFFNEHFELIVFNEVLSYCKNWREILKHSSDIGNFVFVSLYLPNDPIGFVKSFDELKLELCKCFVILNEVMICNDDTILILAENKSKQKG